MIIPSRDMNRLLLELFDFDPHAGIQRCRKRIDAVELLRHQTIKMHTLAERMKSSALAAQAAGNADDLGVNAFTQIRLPFGLISLGSREPYALATADALLARRC